MSGNRPQETSVFQRRSRLHQQWSHSMKVPIAQSILVLFSLSLFGRGLPHEQGVSATAAPPLNYRVGHFDLKDAILRDGIAELGSNSIDGLHLGLEEVPRDKIEQDPRPLSAHFSLHLDGSTVKEILDALCGSDSRYTWSVDGVSINIYPRSTIADPGYLLNLRLEKVALDRVPDPDQALSALSRRYPNEQIGYMQAGGDISYVEPWTVSFEHLAVRQFVNRLAEHMGSQSSWIWQGGRDERMFTFQKGGFQTRPTE